MWPHRPERRTPRRGAGYLLRRTVLFVTLFCAVPALYGRGQQEGVLSRADELIEQKRYKEAMSILVPFAQNNPKQFDEAQQRIHHILFVYEIYNEVVKEVLVELEKPEPNDITVVALTNRLLDLDPERSSETQEFIRQTREVALFRANMRHLDRILAQGKELVDRGEYTEALRTYAEGFTIYQEEFFYRDYNQGMKNRASQSISTIDNNIPAVTSTVNGLVEAVNALEALSSQGVDPQNLAVYQNAYERVAAEMDRVTALRNVFAGTNAVFRDDLAQLRNNYPEDRDRNFLAFAVRLMEGRGDLPGMLGVFDTVWNRAVPKARDLLDTKSRTAYIAAVNDAAQREYGRIGVRADVLNAYATFPADLEERWGRYDAMAPKTTLFGQDILNSEAGNFIKFYSLGDTSGYWRTLGQLGSRFAVIQDEDTVQIWRDGGNSDELIRQEQNSVNSFRQIRQDVDTLVAAIGRETEGYRNLENQFPNSGSLGYIDGVNSAVFDLLNAITIRETASTTRRYIIANGSLENRVIAREGEFRQGEILFQGTHRDDGYLAKYPTRTADLLARMDAAIETDRQALQSLIAQYDAEPSALAGSISSLRGEAEALQRRLENTRSRGQTMMAAARTQSADAENLRREGDRLLDEARQLLARSDFETALTRVEKAGDEYYKSLELEDDDPTWDKRRNTVFNLSGTIMAALNLQVERDVEELLVQIQEDFFNGDLEQATRRIAQAKSRWIRTHTEANGNVEYWDRMIQNAAISSRTISPTAPLYAEMSQLLSDARRKFEEGIILLASSRTEREGNQKLESARQDIVKVKLVFPMNQEAGILSLRIDQQMEPDFDKTLGTRIDSAIARTKSGNNRIEALNELYNLADIFKNERNWPPIIRTAEIDAGIRPPDPTPEGIAAAAAIVARCRPIIASGNVDAIKAIQPDLLEAQRLDRNNRNARDLYTQAARVIAIKTTVLDPEAERLFQQASQALTQGNPIQAQQQLQQIYARNPNYRYVDKVQTLQTRVDRQLS